MAVERARLSMQLASQIRARRDRGPPGASSTPPSSHDRRARLASPPSPRGRDLLGLSLAGSSSSPSSCCGSASQPDCATLMSGVDPAETGELTAALDGAASPTSCRTTAPRSPSRSARPSSHRPGRAGLPATATGPLRSSSTPEAQVERLPAKVSYRRALEGEITRTLEQVEAISGAQVQLVLPEEQLFEASRRPPPRRWCSRAARPASSRAPCAAWPGSSASSVKGLKASNVSITDSTGALVWPKATARAATTPAPRRPRSRPPRSATRALESRLTAMLARPSTPAARACRSRPTWTPTRSTRTASCTRRRTSPGRPDERDPGGRRLGRGLPAWPATSPAIRRPSGGAGSTSSARPRTPRLAVGKHMIRTEKAPARRSARTWPSCSTRPCRPPTCRNPPRGGRRRGI